MRTALLAALLLAGSVARAAGAVETTTASRAAAQTPIPALAPALPAAWSGTDEGAARLLIAAGVAHPDAVSGATADARAAALARGAETLAAQAAESTLSPEQRQALRRCAEAAPTPESREALSKAYGRAERIVDSETRAWRPRDAGALAKGTIGRMARWAAVAAPLGAANAAIEHSIVRRDGVLLLGLDTGDHDGNALLSRYHAAFPETPVDRIHMFWSSLDGWTTPVIHHVADGFTPVGILLTVAVLAALRTGSLGWKSSGSRAKRLGARLIGFGAPVMATGVLLQLFDLLRFGGVFDWLHLADARYVSPGDILIFAGQLAIMAGLLQFLAGHAGEAIARRRAARRRS